MQFEICFLDSRGRLSCLLVSSFSDHRHAAIFARHVMDTAACRDILKSAEILGGGERLAVIVKPARKTETSSRRRSRLETHVANS